MKGSVLEAARPLVDCQISLPGQQTTGNAVLRYLECEYDLP